MLKPTKYYQSVAYEYIEIGKSAIIYSTIDLKKFPVELYTSEVLEYDKVSGRFETLNTIYKLGV